MARKYNRSAGNLQKTIFERIALLALVRPARETMYAFGLYIKCKTIKPFHSPLFRPSQKSFMTTSISIFVWLRTSIMGSINFWFFLFLA